jgi:hypothetical protein
MEVSLEDNHSKYGTAVKVSEEEISLKEAESSCFQVYNHLVLATMKRVDLHHDGKMEQKAEELRSSNDPFSKRQTMIEEFRSSLQDFPSLMDQ